MATIARKYGGVCFDSSVDSEEEDRRTARGVELRRKRKQRKKMSAEFKNGRKKATAKILMDPACLQRLVTLCEQDDVVDTMVKKCLDEFVKVEEYTTHAILLNFHRVDGLTLDTVANNQNAQQFLEFLGTVNPKFQDEFENELPAAAVTSSDDEDADQKRPRKKTKWRQMQANHQAVQADDEVPPVASSVLPAYDLTETFI
jgi:hypothetical protein